MPIERVPTAARPVQRRRFSVGGFTSDMSAALAWAGALMGGHRVSVGISESSSLYASKGADAAADAVDIHIECFAADDISSENDHGFLLPVTMRTAGVPTWTAYLCFLPRISRSKTSKRCARRRARPTIGP